MINWLVFLNDSFYLHGHLICSVFRPHNCEQCRPFIPELKQQWFCSEMSKFKLDLASIVFTCQETTEKISANDYNCKNT